MKKIEVSSLKRWKDFLVLDRDKIKIIFSTAEEGRSFNRNTEDGIKELESLKKDFQVKDVVYLKQIHSDKVFTYRGNPEEFIAQEGDAILTNREDTIIGAFTADCVPVIIIDKNKQVIAAIHSGWRGTFDSITQRVVQNILEEFNSDPLDLEVYIGPHIRQCCYEVSEELKEKFIQKKSIDSSILFNGRNLNMEVCIEEDLLNAGISKDNIYSMGLCTHCEKDIKLHSYRQSVGTYGRLFSFVYIK